MRAFAVLLLTVGVFCALGSPAEAVGRHPALWQLAAHAVKLTRVAPSQPRILYVSDWAGAPQLFEVDPTGRAPFGQLTFLPGGISGPSLSPDGRHLAYLSAAPDEGSPEPGEQVWLARADGTDPHPLPHTDGLLPLTWSPDSTKVAYSASSGSTWTRDVIEVVSAKTLAHREVAIPARRGWALVWSRDSRRITEAFANPFGPIVSPNGKEVASAGPDGISVTELQRHGGSKTPPRLLTSEQGRDLAWAPDGHTIAYLIGTSTPDYRSFLRGSVRTVTLSGKVRTVVDSATGGWVSAFIWAGHPANTYRPVAKVGGLLADDSVVSLGGGGSRVAFATCSGLELWRPQTNQLVDGPADGCGPAYAGLQDYALATDGEQVIYAAAAGGNTVFWEIDRFNPLATTGVVQLGSGTFTGGEPGPEVAGSTSLLVYAAPPTYPHDGSSVQWGIRDAASPGCIGCVITTTTPQPAQAQLGIDVDGERILLALHDSLQIVNRSGAIELNVRLPFVPSYWEGVKAQLAGPDLVLKDGGELLDYDSTTGQLQQQWSPPALAEYRSVLQDAAHGLAAYCDGTTIHILRLADGADTVVGEGTLARFNDDGLAYVDGRRVHFVPYDQFPLR